MLRLHIRQTGRRDHPHDRPGVRAGVPPLPGDLRQGPRVPAAGHGNPAEDQAPGAGEQRLQAAAAGDLAVRRDQARAGRLLAEERHQEYSGDPPGERRDGRKRKWHRRGRDERELEAVGLDEYG